MIACWETAPLTEPLIFDSHAHYDDTKFDPIRDELLAGLPHHGVGGVITCGCDLVSSKKALKLAEQYPYLYAAVGLHPENLDSNTPLAEIAKLSQHEKCVAIGEIGLDYYWRSDNRETQQQVFDRQLSLANELRLPVIVHDREAHADTLALLKKHRPRGVVHSFSGSPEMARELLSLGLYLGIGGALTFKNARRLPEVVAELPLDRLLLETDAPYLTPAPYRSEMNHSGLIWFTAQKAAELKGCSTEEILSHSFKNCCQIFEI